MAKANVFLDVQLTPVLADRMLVQWQIHPKFPLKATATFTVQFSRSPNVDASWETVGTVNMAPGIDLSIADLKRRGWSVFSLWYYRIVLDNDGPVYESEAYPSYGTLSRRDYVFMSNIIRKEYLRLRKTPAGRCTHLFRRMHFGAPAESRNPVTGGIVVNKSEEDYGTGIVGGFWPSICYPVEIISKGHNIAKLSATGTQTDRKLKARAVAAPLPRTGDVIADEGNGRRYRVIDVVEAAMIRHVPLIINIGLEELQPTDIEYKLEV